jgi:DNA-binding MarR family transcriptional regulator
MAKSINVTVGGRDVPVKSPTSPTPYELYKSVAQAERSLKMLVSQELKSHRLTLQQWLVLGSVAQTKTEGISGSELSQQLRLPQARITVVTKQLLERKLLRQKLQRTDRRSRQLLLAARGRAILYDINGVLKQRLKLWLRPIPANHLVFYRRVVAQMATLPPPNLPEQSRASVIK